MDKSCIMVLLSPELYLFNDSGMAKWIGDKVPAAKKRKAMSDVTSRLGNKLTSQFDHIKVLRSEKHSLNLCTTSCSVCEAT